MKKDPFRSCEKGEELLGFEVAYLSAIGARYSFAPTRRHWNGIKHRLHYLAKLLIWVSFTQGNQRNNCLDMQMQDTFQIHIKVGHK